MLMRFNKLLCCSSFLILVGNSKLLFIIQTRGVVHGFLYFPPNCCNIWWCFWVMAHIFSTLKNHHYGATKRKKSKWRKIFQSFYYLSGHFSRQKSSQSTVTKRSRLSKKEFDYFNIVLFWIMYITTSIENKKKRKNTKWRKIFQSFY